MKRKNKHIPIKIMLYLVMLIAAIGWFRKPAVDFGLWSPSEHVEFPLGVLEGIAVDSKQRIYCGTGDSRIQVYDNKGRFIRGWSFHNSGLYKIKIDNKDRLHIVTYRGYLHYVYDVNGELLLKENKDYKFIENFNKYEDKGVLLPDVHRLLTGIKNNKNITRDPRFDVRDKKGNLYIARGILFPKVYKLTPDNRLSTIISVPWYKWIFMSPFPAWLIGVFSVVSIGILEKIERRQVKKLAGIDKKDIL